MKFKKKLISATLSLVVATVLMASSSYAWFTISTNPEISKIKTSITANENIEIALDNGYENAEAIDAASAVVSGTGTAGNPYTWGNLLDMTTAMTNIGANLSLKPVGYSTKTEGSETKVVMKTPQYGLDGRVAKLVDMAQEYISAYDGVTTPSGGISIFKQTEDTDEADALALSFWLRANADVSLQLSDGTYRADDGTNTAGTVNAENGGGSRLTITIPEETVEKASSLRTQIDALLNEMSLYVSQKIVNIFDPMTYSPSYLRDSWSLCYSSLKSLLSEMANLPINYSIHGVFQYADYKFSLEDMNDFIFWSEGEINEFFSYGDPFVFKGHQIDFGSIYHNGSWGSFESEITMSSQLLRLLNKLKIRFVVTSEDGTQELYAKIKSNYTINSDYINQETLPEAYRYYPVYEGVTFSDSYLPSIIACESTKLTPALNGNAFNLSLSFFDENDDGFEEYLTCFEIEIGINDGLYSGYIVDEIVTKIRDVYIDYDYYETCDNANANLKSFLLETNDKLRNDCLMQFPHIDLSANEAKKVDVYMYLDGELITNADAITMDGVEIALNLQFEKIGGAKNAMTGRVYVEESESETE